MRVTAVGAIVCALLSGCVLHRIPEPLDEPYVWDDSARPVSPLRADAAKAAGIVVEYAEQVGLISKTDCEWSRHVFQVITSQTPQAFQVTLVRRPGWCKVENENTIPPMGNGVDEGGIEWAVRRSDMRLLRQRSMADPYRLKGKLYGTEGHATEGPAQAEQPASAPKDGGKPGSEGASEPNAGLFDEIIKKWQERFSSRSPQAQEAFKSKKFVPGMSREEFEMLVAYRRELFEIFDLVRLGESEEIGKKKDVWLVCQPDCNHAWDPVHVTFENDVLIRIQTGEVAP